MKLTRNVFTLVACMVSASAVAGDVKTFERIKENYVDLGMLLDTVAESKRDCSCLDEFEEKACIDARASALDTLKMKFTASLRVGEDPIVVKLGKYDFKKHVFPASIAGGALHAVPFATCAGKLKPSDPCANFEGSMVDAPESKVVVAVKNPAWQGQIGVDNEDDAQQYRNAAGDNYLINGELVLKVDSVTLAIKENPQLAAKKKIFLAAFDDALKRKGSRMGPSDLASYREERVCHAKVPTNDVTVTVSASVVGIRLEANAAPEYLVSNPPSEEGRSDRMQREAAEAAKVAAEAAAKKEEQARLEREAAEKVKAEAAMARRKRAEAERQTNVDRCKRVARNDYQLIYQCNALALSLLAERDLPADPVAAKTILLSLCSDLSAEACNLLGQNISSGKIAGEKNSVGSYTALAQAIMSCDRNAGSPGLAGPSCGLIAQELGSGRIVNKDAERAAKYASQGCQRRNQESCNLLEKLKATPK